MSRLLAIIFPLLKSGHPLNNSLQSPRNSLFRTHHDPEHLPTEQYDAQLAEKVVRLQSMMAPFSAPVPEVFRSPVSHYRMRAEFRIWHDGDDLYHIIFDQQTKSRIRVDSFPAAANLLTSWWRWWSTAYAATPVLRHKLFQIDYLTTLSNQAIVSCCTTKAERWVASAGGSPARCTAGAEHQCPSDWPGDENQNRAGSGLHRWTSAGRRGEMIYRQVENSFTQPNAAMNVQMLEWGAECNGKAQRATFWTVLRQRQLFAGAGA